MRDNQRVVCQTFGKWTGGELLKREVCSEYEGK